MINLKASALIRVTAFVVLYNTTLHSCHAYETLTHQKMGEVARQRFEDELLSDQEKFPSAGLLLDSSQRRLNDALWGELNLWLEKEDTEGIYLNARYHFWDPIHNRGLYTFSPAVSKAQEFFDKAINEYFQLNYLTAFQYLGRVCHLMGDAACPAHTLIDPHYDPAAKLIADPDIDSLHKYAGTGDVIDAKPPSFNSFHWRGGEIPRHDRLGEDTRDIIKRIMKAIAIESVQWDSDDANGEGSAIGSGNLNGNRWRIDSASTWYTDIWRASELGGLPRELHRWIESDKSIDSKYRLVEFLFNEIPNELMSSIYREPDYQLSTRQVEDIIEALKGTILTAETQDAHARREIWEYPLKTETKSWAGSTKQSLLPESAIDLYDVARLSDPFFLERKKLGILLELFPIGLSKGTFDSKLINPIKQTDLKRIAQGNIPNAEKGIAETLRYFIDKVRPGISMAEKAKPLRVEDEVYIELRVNLSSNYSVSRHGERRGLSKLVIEITPEFGPKLPLYEVASNQWPLERGVSLANLPVLIPENLLLSEQNLVRIWVVDIGGVYSYPVEESISLPKDSGAPIVKNVRP